jgi:hypothetical protein
MVEKEADHYDGVEYFLDKSLNKKQPFISLCIKLNFVTRVDQVNGHFVIKKAVL